MRRAHVLITAGILLILLPLPGLAKTVNVIEIHEPITSATVSFIKDALAQAAAEEAEALIIELDTPGGMVSSTKEIVKLFYDAKVPVVVYVSPAGASATSAGLMITIAAHIAVMAPGTNIGASHPVMISPQGEYKSIPKNDIMMEKATQDTVGWVKSICDVRGRNPELAEAAVVESRSYTAKEAVEGGLVDGIAESLEELVNEFLPGRKVTLSGGETKVLDTKAADIKRVSRNLSQLVHKWVNDPTVIAILFLLGGLGIAIEFKAPGLLFPALIGASLIIIALLAPSIPINYLGVVLILIGIALLVAEAFITSYGILSVSGVTALVFGFLTMFKAKEMPEMDPFLVPELRPSWSLIVGLALFAAAVILLVGRAVVKTHRQKVFTGQEELIGVEAEAVTDIGPEGGRIFVHGEYWSAVSDSPIAKGEKVVIKSMDNLVCKVEKK